MSSGLYCCLSVIKAAYPLLPPLPPAVGTTPGPHEYTAARQTPFLPGLPPQSRFPPDPAATTADRDAPPASASWYPALPAPAQPQTRLPGHSAHPKYWAANAGADAANIPADRSDRKSTRLNSSHQIISYAVFCLKKKTCKHTLCGSNLVFRTDVLLR